MPSGPYLFTMFIHLPAKFSMAILLQDPSVVIKLVEKLGRILWIQPIMKNVIFTQHLHVLISFDEVVQ
jgi:hypothetical protein